MQQLITPCCVGPPEKEKGMYIATTDYPLVHEIDPDTLRVKQAIPFTGNLYPLNYEIFRRQYVDFIYCKVINARKVICSYAQFKTSSLWVVFANKNRCISVRLVSEEVKSIKF